MNNEITKYRAVIQQLGDTDTDEARRAVCVAQYRLQLALSELGLDTAEAKKRTPAQDRQEAEEAQDFGRRFRAGFVRQ